MRDLSLLMMWFGVAVVLAASCIGTLFLQTVRRKQGNPSFEKAPSQLVQRSEKVSSPTTDIGSSSRSVSLSFSDIPAHQYLFSTLQLQRQSNFRLYIPGPADIERLMTIYVSAFDGPFIRVLFPGFNADLEGFRTVEIARHLPTLSDPAVGWAASVDEDGKIVAFGKWERRGGKPAVPKPPPKLPAWNGEMNKELCARFFGSMAQIHARIMGDQPHFRECSLNMYSGATLIECIRLSRAHLCH
jgi:hypothetical protein